ncbi:hypothetical protein QUB60_05975 [Microcoleus sp. A2-C5]|nr:hypothetical protein [Lyngbya sp. CCAP 1446/10]MCW6050412.1 hypothetical protein [Lyngbya sp. CCAP 1446/10]
MPILQRAIARIRVLSNQHPKPNPDNSSIYMPLSLDERSIYGALPPMGDLLTKSATQVIFLLFNSAAPSLQPSGD